MSQPPSEFIEESVKEDSVSIDKASVSKQYKSNFAASKFEMSLHNSHNSINMSGLLKNAKMGRKEMDEKYLNVYNRVEKLKKDYDSEINNINGLRNKSLYLYKLKRDADQWNKKRSEFLEKSRKEHSSHKQSSKNNKLMQEMLVAQIKSEVLQEKQKNVRKMKELKSQLTQEYLRNYDEDKQKRLNSHGQVVNLHHIQQIKKQKYKEKKDSDLSRFLTEKISEEDQKKQMKNKSIDELQNEELQLLKKLRGFHKIHEMAFLEYVDVKSKPLNAYEKKYQNPIKLDPITL